MRTDNAPSLASPLTRLRASLDRAWRRVWAQGPLTRRLLALGSIVAVVTVGYMATPTAPGVAYLHSGQRFSADEIARITRALDAKHIRHSVDDRRIEVVSDRLDEATEALAKLDVGPPSIEDIRKDAGTSSPWDSPWDIEQRERLGREKFLAAMIRKFDRNIVSAYVSINRTRARSLHAASPPTAFVSLETEDHHEITHRTVQAIQNLIVGAEPDLKRDAVTIMDEQGNRYLDADDPTTSMISRTRAREEQLGEQILEKLDWIKGVRVVVQLVPAPAPVPALTPTAPPASVPGGAEASVKVNQPLELDPEPPGPVALPSPAPAPKPAAEVKLARVMVNVPRSFYYLKSLPNRAPSADDLQPVVARTEALIKSQVEHVVPPGELEGPALVNTIPDDVPAAVPSNPSPLPELRRPMDWWITAGAAGAMAATLLLVGLRLLATRRPGARPSPSSLRGRDRRTVASEAGHGVSERVRELIRRNPEAAAGVLNRWIGQGGQL